MNTSELQQLIREILSEKKVKRDRCLRIADRKFDKPSAYKSGAVVRCRAGKIWKDIKEDIIKQKLLQEKNQKASKINQNLTNLIEKMKKDFNIENEQF